MRQTADAIPDPTTTTVGDVKGNKTNVRMLILIFPKQAIDDKFLWFPFPSPDLLPNLEHHKNIKTLSLKSKYHYIL